MPHFNLPGSAYSPPQLTPTAVVDILAVAFLIYQLLLILRGTRAAHILVGISTIIVVYGISVLVGLDALRSMLSYIVPYTAIAVIILFQSEFRRTLARIGRKRWFGGGFRRPEALDEILLAMNTLAQDKTGAIIVLERDIGLRTFVESGVRVDAQISRDLLLAIFRPGGALHDGAAIIQKDRISAAACFLPLSTNPNIASNFGTRHRAGIGITEETDCLTLLVSEETGWMSIAAFGELYPNLPLAEVDERVNRHFGVGKYKSRHLESDSRGRAAEKRAERRIESEKVWGG